MFQYCIRKFTLKNKRLGNVKKFQRSKYLFFQVNGSEFVQLKTTNFNIFFGQIQAQLDYGERECNVMV